MYFNMCSSKRQPPFNFLYVFDLCSSNSILSVFGGFAALGAWLKDSLCRIFKELPPYPNSLPYRQDDLGLPGELKVGSDLLGYHSCHPGTKTLRIYLQF